MTKAKMAARRKASRHDNPEFAASPLSLRWNVVTEAISLQATFVFGLLRYARNDKSQDCHTMFAMTNHTMFAITN